MRSRRVEISYRDAELLHDFRIATAFIIIFATTSYKTNWTEITEARISLVLRNAENGGHLVFLARRQVDSEAEDIAGLDA